MGDDEIWPVYWRLYQRAGGRPTVVCMQDFDQPDYNAEHFVTNIKYGSKAEAEAALNAEIGRAWRLLHG